MKKVIILVLVLLCSFFMKLAIVSAGGLKDGWHMVTSLTDKSDYNWAYYKNGVEKTRVSHLIYAHRGWGTAPENSLASIKEVKNQGYYAYETDVRFTKDGIPVLSHDATINRIARNSDMSELSQKINVKDLTLAELNKYDYVVSRTGEVLKKYKGNKITKFEDALIYSKNNGLTIAIELKAGTKEQIASLVKLVKKYDMDNVVKWISFQKNLLLYVNAADDNEFLGFITNGQTAEEIKKIREELKTKNNIVAGLDIVSHHVTANMPDTIDKYPMSKYILKAIPKATIKINETKLTLTNNNSVTKKYEYNGDGEIMCKSSNKSYVTCKIDKKNKTITISALKASSNPITITLSGNQGINYSAASDQKIEVSIEKFQPIIDLADIKVKYTGSSSKIKANVRLESGNEYKGTIKYNYYEGNNCKGKLLSSSPINAGNYSAQAEIKSTSNYKSAKSRCANLIILKADSVLNVSTSKLIIEEKEAKINYEYKGDGILTCKSNNLDIGCQIDYDNQLLILTANKKTSGVVTLTASEGNNYSENNITINIEKNSGFSLNLNNNVLYVIPVILIIVLLVFVLKKKKS